MFKRISIGVDIRTDALTAIALTHQRKQTSVLAGRVHQLPPGLVQPAFHKPNIRVPGEFVSALQALLEPLPQNDHRIAVSLPDRAGQLFLLQVETPFKSRQEGADVIRWNLKERWPDTPADKIALDYQILSQTENGSKWVLAAALRTEVLEQYEAVFEQAGYAGAVIDFHALALYNAYRNILDLGRDFIFIGLDDGQFSLLSIINRIPSFLRTRAVEMEAAQVFHELNRSLVKLRQEPVFQRMPVYVHASAGFAEFKEAVEGTFEQSVQWLSSPLLKCAGGDLLKASAPVLTTAYGVAERLWGRS